MELQKRISEITGEELYFGKHSSGLGVYIVPKKDYSKVISTIDKVRDKV